MSNKKTEMDAQLKVWGNSYGIMVPKALAERLGLQAGMHLHVTLEHEPARNDPSKLITWDFPHRPTKEILDEED